MKSEKKIQREMEKIVIILVNARTCIILILTQLHAFFVALRSIADDIHRNVCRLRKFDSICEHWMFVNVRFPVQVNRKSNTQSVFHLSTVEIYVDRTLFSLFVLIFPSTRFHLFVSSTIFFLLLELIAFLSFACAYSTQFISLAFSFCFFLYQSVQSLRMGWLFSLAFFSYL